MPRQDSPAERKTTLRNPHAGALRVGRVMADLDEGVFNYFFDPKAPCLFTGSRGVRQAILAQFFDKLHIACLQRGLTPEWNPENETVVQQILDDMNFNAVNYNGTETHES